jgi:hypothetical protein
MKILRILFFVLISALAIPSLNVGASSYVQDANKTPAIVFLIRHAEKPAPEEKSSHLSPEGMRRAQWLPSLFVASGSQLARFPRPDILFATAESKHSNREVETLTPISVALGLPILHDYLDDDFDAAAKDILSGKYAGKVVLVCWHHGRMPALAHALGAADAPAKIGDSVFDALWRIEWKEGKAAFSSVQQGFPPTGAMK